MDEVLQLVINLISSVGFPIAMCCALFWFINKTISGLTNTINELRTTISDNMNAVNHLIDELRKYDITIERN